MDGICSLEIRGIYLAERNLICQKTWPPGDMAYHDNKDTL